jgi:porin
MQFGGVSDALGRFPVRRAVDLVARRAIRFAALAMGVAAWSTAGPADAQPEPQEAAGPPAEAPQPPAEHGWLDGEHLTGNWGGARSALADHGVTIDVFYASEAFTARGAHSVLGHVDAAITLDTHKLGLWDGGTFYALGQNNHGNSGITDTVGSAQPVTNLEAEPYTQLTELFFEQTALDERLRIRIGKQDANRDFGTPRFGGNFINNNFGMYPTSPLPSYPTTGLGALVAVQPVAWLTGKAGIYEGNPDVGGFGLTSAFQSGNGYTLVGGAAATHHYGPADRDGGTTSAGAWWRSGDFMEVGSPGTGATGMPRTFDSNAGWFVQNDERIYLHPSDPDDPRGLTVILRASWARPDRTPVTRYAGGSAAWHGIGPRRNDTVGLGAGYFRVAEPLGGSPRPGDEYFVEAFYKLRLTAFFSLQPDLQWFHHPGGDGADALVAGLRVKVKL